MRYEKGSKVEVLNKQEVPSGSWRCAVIISGNGHTYSVRYDPCSSGMDELVERVSRKVVRPCPPLVQGPCSWMSGDVVEVFDNGSWKLAEVSSAVEGNHFLVRLLGSSNVFKVHKSDLRLRQCWQDNRWVVIRKDVKNSDNGKLLKGGCLWRVGCQQTGGFLKAQHCEETTIVEEPKLVFFGGKKRGFQSCSPPPETFYKVTKKPKTGDAEGRCQKLSVDSEYRLQEKVDAVALPQMMMGGTYMHASLNNMTGCSQLDMEAGKPNGYVACFFTRCLEPSDASVCSSSGSNDLDMLYHYPFTAAILDRNSLSDDADSSCLSKLRESRSFHLEGSRQ